MTTNKCCSSVRFDCVQRPLSRLFSRLARSISSRPWLFIIIPCVITGLVCIGFVRFRTEADAEYLYTPTNGPAKDERKVFQRLFSENKCGDFVSSRKSELDGYTNVIVQRSDGGDVLSDTSAIFALDEETRREIVVRHGDIVYDYEALCGKWDGRCETNTLLAVLNTTSGVNITYPVHNRLIYMGRQLGGVELEGDTNIVKSAKAVMLSYFSGCVNTSDPDYEVTIELEWQESFKNYFLKRNNDGQLKIDFLTSLSLEEGIEESVDGIIPIFSITYTIVFTFTVSTCMMKDWVRSKFWYGWGGILTISIAITSALGFGLLVGLPLISTVGSMPFLIVGIGVDDLFVLLAAWRSTSYNLPTDERMSESYSDAAVSVTVTSLTNILAFGIGAITTFPSVQIFCLYTGAGVLFAFLYIVMIQGAFLYYTGLAEEKNRHSVTCMPATYHEDAEGRSGCHRAFCVGGTKQPKSSDSDNMTSDITETGLSRVLRCHYGPFLMKWPVKLLSILALMGYLGVAIWGCINLQEGLLLSNLSPDDSSTSNYYKAEYAYFNNKYGVRVMFAFTEQLDYHDEAVQRSTFDVVRNAQSKSYFESSEDLTEYWLRDYLTYLTLRGTPLVNKTEFMRIIQDEFFNINGFDRYRVDVTFNGDRSEIIASRFLVQAGESSTTNDEKGVLLQAREVASEAFTPMTAYHPAFIFYDQYVVVLSNTLQNMGIALGCMMVVSLLLIPSPLCVIWVTLSVASICTGVIGYMSLWDVSLDSVSMINVIMCIGFSVDYSVHISYHYVISAGKTRNEKAIDSIGTLGMPIIQGAVSTILGVSILSTSDAYIFRTFFKIMFLVIGFGFVHAMVFLPVLLTIFGPGAHPTGDLSETSSSQVNPWQVKAEKQEQSVSEDLEIATSVS